MPGAEGQAAVPVLVDGLPDKTDTSGVYEQYKGYWGEYRGLMVPPLRVSELIATFPSFSSNGIRRGGRCV
jgi:hypothetical protein